MTDNIEVALHEEVMGSWRNDLNAAVSWKMLKEATNSDRQLMTLREIIEDGSQMENPLVGELAAFSRCRQLLWT